MSARRSGSRSSQRSARFRMLSVATRSDPSPAVCPVRGRSTPTDDATGSVHGERRSPPLLGLDPDPAAVPLDDVAGDRQSKPRSAAADAHPVDLVEPLEDPALVGLRDADAVVLDRQRDLVADAPNRDPDLGVAVVARAVRVLRVEPELQGVVEEVDDDLAEPRLVAANRRHRLADVDDEPEALAIGEEPQSVGRLGRRPARGRRRRAGPAGRRPRSGRGRAAR